MSTTKGPAWLQLSETAISDEEGYLTVFSNHELDTFSRVEGRVRLELECVSQCLLVQLEEDRRGLVLSLNCQYDDEGGPTDQLSQVAGVPSQIEGYGWNLVLLYQTVLVRSDYLLLTRLVW